MERKLRYQFITILLSLLPIALASAGDETADGFVVSAEGRGNGVYTNWIERVEEGTHDIVMAEVDENGIVLREGVYDSRTQEGDSTESGEPFVVWLGRWRFSLTVSDCVVRLNCLPTDNR